jgi:hypothetical protein
MAGLMIKTWGKGLVLAAALSLTACSMLEDRHNIREGLLTVGIAQSAFLSVWGKPTYTSAMSGDEVIRSVGGGRGGFFFRGNRIYEAWDYPAHKTTLIFSERVLVSWKTEQTVDELAHGQAPAAKNPAAEQ